MCLFERNIVDLLAVSCSAQIHKPTLSTTSGCSFENTFGILEFSHSFCHGTVRCSRFHIKIIKLFMDFGGHLVVFD